jgi:hypothetical protein
MAKTVQIVKEMRDYTRQSLLKIPNKNPKLNYRFIRNTPENIALMEAKGYKIADGEIVRQAGLKPREDGTYRVGDLILGVEEYAHHKEHKDKELEFRKRQEELMRRGLHKRGRIAGVPTESTEKLE